MFHRLDQKVGRFSGNKIFFMSIDIPRSQSSRSQLLNIVNCFDLDGNYNAFSALESDENRQLALMTVQH
jgi:hypothetical protein